MSTASYEPSSGDDHLMTPHRVLRRDAHAVPSCSASKLRGPRFVLRVPDLNAPALSAVAQETSGTITTADSTAAPEEDAGRKRLGQALRRVGRRLELRQHFWTAVRAVLVRNLFLLAQPQLWLQPKLLLAGVGAIVMTMAGLILTGNQSASENDELGAAPTWQAPAIAAPDWNTVADPAAPTVGSTATAETEETEAPPFHATIATQEQVPMAVQEPIWCEDEHAPSASATTVPPSQPLTAEGTSPPNHGPASRATANRPASVERYPETIARRPELPSPYPPTTSEAPPRARITGRITVLPGEPTP